VSAAPSHQESYQSSEQESHDDQDEHVEEAVTNAITAQSVQSQSPASPTHSNAPSQANSRVTEELNVSNINTREIYQNQSRTSQRSEEEHQGEEHQSGEDGDIPEPNIIRDYYETSSDLVKMRFVDDLRHVAAPSDLEQVRTSIQFSTNYHCNEKN
jgi:hypothetical protein